MATQKARFLLRSGTAAEWASANPVLAAGEPGLETDTAIFKIGDGTTAWATLPAYERNRQAANANLTAEAGLTGAADRVSYYTGVGAKALAAFTAAGRALVGAANAAAQRTALELGGLATQSILDEDSFATNSATRPPSQKSAKTYIAAYVADIINGVAGKPKVQANALSGIVRGEVSASGVGVWSGIGSLDGARHLMVNIFFRGGTSIGTINVRFSNDSGVTWGASQVAISGVNSSAGFGWFRISFSNNGFGCRILGTADGYQNEGFLTVPAGVNAIQFSLSSSNTVRFDYFVLGGLT